MMRECQPRLREALMTTGHLAEARGNTTEADAGSNTPHRMPSIAALIGAVCVLYLCAEACAQGNVKPHTLSITGKADHIVSLGAHGNHDTTSCAPGEPPV